MNTVSKAIPVHDIKSLADYVTLVERTFDEDYMLFRGQRQDWSLLPKISRVKLRSGLSIHDTELKMIQEFKRISKPFLVKDPQNEWEWLALAQHYGMSTRLLD